MKDSTIVHWTQIHIDEILKATPPGLSSGFKGIDDILGGIRPGELTSITGDTASGKTTFSLNLAYNICSIHKVPILIASQEMKKEKIAEKIISIMTKYPLRKGLDDERIKNFIVNEMSKLEIFIDSKGINMTLDSVIEIVEYYSFRHGVKFFVIEDLGFIAKTINRGDERLNIEFAIQVLHSKALECDVHIAVIVHPIQSKDDRGHISMAMMKGSSGIKQYSDNVLIVQRMDRAFPERPEAQKFTKISIAKNRAMGDEGAVYLEYHKDYDGFSTPLSQRNFGGKI